MLDLKLLSYAQALARHRNFARAAEALDLSQPALSRSISGLEKSLGVQLFDRTRQGVELTAFGERFLMLGDQLLRDASELEREIRLMQGLDVGVLRVGTGPFPAELCLPSAIAQLAVRHPHLRIELNGDDWRSIIGDLLHARLDIAVMELSVVTQEPRLQIEPLPRHEAAFFCRAGHPALAEPALSLERMSEFPFVGPRMPARAASLFYQRAKIGVIDPNTGDYVPPIKVDTFTVAMKIVLASDAISVAPLALIAERVEDGSIVALPFREPWLHTEYGFVRLKDRSPSPASHAFVAEVKAAEARLMERERVLSAGIAAGRFQKVVGVAT